MCMVSMVMDAGKLDWDLNKFNNWSPSVTPDSSHYMQMLYPNQQFDFEGFKKYMELVNKAAEYDKITNQPKCESKEKISWLKEIQVRLDRITEASNTINYEVLEIKTQVEKFLKEHEETT